MNKIALNVQKAFEKSFGYKPTHLIRAPGRVNLIGEHTDYSGGFVLPVALEEALWIAVRPRKDQAVILHSLDYNDSTEIILSKPQSHLKGWREYLSGIVWVLQEANWHLSGWEGVMSGNIPRGAGLSSSAALEIALIRTFSEISEISWEPKFSAKLAQRAESEWVGVKCGIMDQLVSACGVSGHAIFIDCRNLEIQQIPFPKGIRLIILDTKTRRGLVDSHYNERHSQCKEASAILGKSMLRDATMFDLDEQSTGMESLLYRRAKHVITENERVLQAVDAMCANDHLHLGQLMYDSHKSLRDDFEVSNSSLDEMVECALNASGCLGARMTGAGFGGCVVALVKAEKEKGFVDSIRECYLKKTNQNPQIISCKPDDGASRHDPLTNL